MSRLRAARNFNQRSVASASREPVRKFFFAYEGSRTEPDYFEGLEKHRYSLKINNLIELVRLKRDADDGKSHPNHILKGATEYLDSGDATYDSEIDEIWLVFDRDRQNVSTEQLDNIISECDKKGFSIALSNPTFEFWLLCHFDDVNILPKDELLKNSHISSKHRYISKQLPEIIPTGYNKNKLKFSDFKDRIGKAVINSRNFATDIETLKTELGTYMGVLMDKLIKE